MTTILTHYFVVNCMFTQRTTGMEDGGGREGGDGVPRGIVWQGTRACLARDVGSSTIFIGCGCGL